MKVLLVAIHAHPSPQAVPLANGFLKSYLGTHEELSGAVSVSLLDFFAGDPSARCISAILAEKPDAVGFSVYLWNREKCAEIASRLHRDNPALILFAGGPEPTAHPEVLLSEAPFGFVISGEGEIPFLRAMASLQAGDSLAGIKGITRREGTAVIGLDPQEPPDLGSIPSPYLAGHLDASDYGGVLWQLSRGCAFGCDFCFDNRGRRGTRLFSSKQVRDELLYFVKKGVSQVFVLDSTFNYNPARAKEILGLIRKNAPHIHFHFEVRSEFLDREMANMFSRVNCSLQIGLQSSDPQVQKQVGRFFDRTDFIDKITLLNQAGAVFGFDLMYGLPGDTLAGFVRSMDFSLALYPNHLDIFPLAVLPGTALAARADSLGLDYLRRPPYTLLESPTFPASDMRKAASLAAACDIFYSRGKAVAWFNTICTPLEMTASTFLRSFQEWLTEKRGTETNEAELDDLEIWRLQRDFLHMMYVDKKDLQRLLPAALDLVDYHYHYAAALLAPAPELPTDRELEQGELLGQRFIVDPSTRLADFNYEIFDILEAGDIDLAEFTDCFSPAGSCAAIYPRAGEVFTESLDPRYYTLLQRLDGRTPADPLAAGLGLSPEEALSFLEFAAAEGIIVRTRQTEPSRQGQ